MHLQTITRLLSPFKYLKIKHSAKRVYDLWLPIALSFISVVVYFNIPRKPPFFGENGIIPYISEILKFLSPFFIAALAAVATFQSKAISAPLDGTPPSLVVTIKGQKTFIILNRRQFLCFAFGYLSLASLFLYFIGYISWIVSLNAASFISIKYILIAKIAFSFIYFFLFYNIITTTMLGLYYLTDRLHQDGH